MKKSLHYPLVLAVIAALCVLGIDVVYSTVAEKIKIADTKKALNAVCCIYPDCTAEQIEPAESEYEGDTIKWYKCTGGYAVIASAPGFDGAVTLMAGWDKTLENLQGIYVLSHTETPGLGGNVDLINSENTWYNVITFSTKLEVGKRPDFQEQFKELTISELELKPAGKIEALTGATITSVAVIKAVKKSHDILTALLENR